VRQLWAERARPTSGKQLLGVRAWTGRFARLAWQVEGMSGRPSLVRASRSRPMRRRAALDRTQEVTERRSASTGTHSAHGVPPGYAPRALPQRSGHMRPTQPWGFRRGYVGSNRRYLARNSDPQLVEPTTFCMTNARRQPVTADAVGGHDASASLAAATRRICCHFRCHPASRRRTRGAQAAPLQGFSEGPAWTRTRDRRIMSPLL
jgi:hypothetical protein